MDFWPWWLGAIGLAAAALSYLVLVGRGLGVSGILGAALLRAEPWAAGPGRGESGLFLVGVVLGGGLFAVVAHTGIETAPAGMYARIFGSLAWPALFFGGVLVGAGTALAGGCTSGHGLVGCGRLQVPSLVATACFFGTGIALALAVRALVLGGAP